MLRTITFVGVACLSLLTATMAVSQQSNVYGQQTWDFTGTDTLFIIPEESWLPRLSVVRPQNTTLRQGCERFMQQFRSVLGNKTVQDCLRELQYLSGIHEQYWTVRDGDFDRQLAPTARLLVPSPAITTDMLQSQLLRHTGRVSQPAQTVSDSQAVWEAIADLEFYFDAERVDYLFLERELYALEERFINLPDAWRRDIDSKINTLRRRLADQQAEFRSEIDEDVDGKIEGVLSDFREEVTSNLNEHRNAVLVALVIFTLLLLLLWWLFVKRVKAVADEQTGLDQKRQALENEQVDLKKSVADLNDRSAVHSHDIEVNRVFLMQTLSLSKQFAEKVTLSSLSWNGEMMPDLVDFKEGAVLKATLTHDDGRRCEVHFMRTAAGFSVRQGIRGLADEHVVAPTYQAVLLRLINSSRNNTLEFS